MLFNLKTTAAYVVITSDVNTNLFGALRYFQPGMTMRDSFTFHTEFGDILVVGTYTHEEGPCITVSEGIATQIHNPVRDVLAGMLYIAYSKFHGIDCEELIAELDQAYNLLTFSDCDLTAIHDIKTDKVYFSNDGFDEEGTTYSTEIDMCHIDQSTITNQLLFSDWADYITMQGMEFQAVAVEPEQQSISSEYEDDLPF